MKNLFSLLLLIFFSISYSQERYEYVVIPKQFDGFNGKENPYRLSSSIHFLLKRRNIKAFYQGKNNNLQTPCNGLTAYLKNTSTMFKNKIRFILENCNGTEVYSAEGKGKSKEFQTGYTEALQEAMAGLQKLPYKDEGVQSIQAAIPLTPTITEKPIQEIVETTDEYEAKNLYFNSTYMLDLIEEKGKKHLKIINGELLGYKKLQTIASLSPSGIGNTFLIQWITPSGQSINGMAKFEGKELQISLPSESGNKLIKVKKP